MTYDLPSKPRSGHGLALVLASASLVSFLVSFASGCNGSHADRKDENASGQKSSTQQAGDDRVALVLEGEKISVADVDAFLQEQFLEELRRRPENQIYEAREQAMQGLLERHVVEAEARARGTTPEALREEIAGSVEEPSDAEVSAWYAENQNRLRGAKLEEIEPQIRTFLLNEKMGRAWREFLDAELAEISYERVLQPPRQDLEATRLIRGRVDAPVTLMTFSDYQCPYCIRSESTLEALLERYPDDVRVVYRHFPLDRIHPFARPAAEAAMCADEQERFWDYHDAIFARQGRLEEGSLSEIAEELELDLEAFGRCVDERRYAGFVEQDVAAGERAGVTGTPAYFVNGIALKGARDVDDLSRVIDRELERLEKGTGSDS